MKENENYLVRTTFDEIASDVDEAKLYEEYYFSTQDKKELEDNNEEPSEYFTVGKVHFDFQDSDDYSILIKRMDGSQVELKSIDIVSEGHLDDEDARIWGIRDFLEDYCEKNMPKNSTNEVYYFYKYED